MRKTATILFALLLMCGRLAWAQGFIDLDFESANIQNGQAPGVVSAANALLGWSVFYGTSQQTQITYNEFSAGATAVSLLGMNGSQLAGNYSVLLVGGIGESAATITQTGLVPAFAQSLLFIAASDTLPDPMLQVTLGGQNLSLVTMSVGPNYTSYGANISAFAGQTLPLTFSAPSDYAVSGLNYWTIDNIQFSPLAVPEPGILSLFALGGGLFLAWRRCRKVVKSQKVGT